LIASSALSTICTPFIVLTKSTIIEFTLNSASLRFCFRMLIYIYYIIIYEVSLLFPYLLELQLFLKHVILICAALLNRSVGTVSLNHMSKMLTFSEDS
jgi:hypothetical protein